MQEEMIELEINFTEEDLESDMMNEKGCAAFHAIKRHLPNLYSWGWYCGHVLLPVSMCLEIPKEVGKKLIRHANWQLGYRDPNSSMNPAEKATPFSCIMTVPKRILN